ncbi:MAG: hypothetical protein WBB45_01355 [Cyclobacteriaceae bacterium]
MKFVTTEFSFISQDYRLSGQQSLHITGGSGKVDRDKEEKEDMPEVSNDIPGDYAASRASSRSKLN